MYLIQVYFKNYVYKTKNILQIIKLKNATMRSSLLYDVNCIVKIILLRNSFFGKS
jgi:hypothetical protein